MIVCASAAPTPPSAAPTSARSSVFSARTETCCPILHFPKTGNASSNSLLKLFNVNYLFEFKCKECIDFPFFLIILNLKRCRYSTNSEAVGALEDAIEEQLDEIGKSGEFARYEDFIDKYSDTILHRNHFLIMTATRQGQKEFKLDLLEKDLFGHSRQEPHSVPDLRRFQLGDDGAGLVEEEAWTLSAFPSRAGEGTFARIFLNTPHNHEI